MRRLIYAPQPALVDWVCGQLDIKNPGPASAIGIMYNGRVVGAAMFNNLHMDAEGKPLTIEISFVTIDKKWASRNTVTEILSYPYLQLGVKRVQATVAKRNMPVRHFLERLGFKFEGIARLAWPKGGDAACYSLLRHECKWLKNGEISTFGTGSARPERNVGGANQVEPRDGAL